MKTEHYDADFERFTISLPGECISALSAHGSVDDAVTYWAAKLPMQVDPEPLRKELSEYGAWDEEGLSDTLANWKRIIWLAACQIRERRAEESRRFQSEEIDIA